MNEKQLAVDIVSDFIICEMAKNLHCDLLTRTANTGAIGQYFKASGDWFDRFAKESDY